MGEPISYNPEWDAQTLAEAEAIKADSSRLAAAKLAAGRLEKEARAKAVALEKVTSKIYDHPESVRAREERKKQASSVS